MGGCIEWCYMENTKLIPINLIDRPNPPVRLKFDEQEIESLRQSIEQNGVLVPLLVRPKGDRFEVIDGDCRLEASGRARIGEISCVVRDTSDSETHVLRMLANLDRSNPDVVSEAIYIARALQNGSIKIEEFAQKLHRKESWIEDRLIIAEMPDYMQEALRNKEIGLGVALELYEVKDEAWRTRYVSMAKNDGMTSAIAKACRQQWDETRQRFEEAGIALPVEEIPTTPPIIQGRCEKCGLIDNVHVLQFVRIHVNECPKE